MGAEGKYDLRLAHNYDPDLVRSSTMTTSTTHQQLSPTASIAVTNTTDSAIAKGSVSTPNTMFPGRKSSSTSSLLEPSSSSSRITVACTEQAASADSLVARKAMIAGSLTRSSGDSSLCDRQSNENVAVGLSPTQEETEELLAENERPGTPTPVLNDEIQRRSSSSSTIKNTEHSSHLIRSNNNTNNMSVSVPNLTLNTINVNDSTVGLLDAFASAARRRTHSNQQNSTNATNNANAGNSLLSRGSNNVCSLVRLALSSNFPGNLPGITYLFKIFLKIASIDFFLQKFWPICWKKCQ